MRQLLNEYFEIKMWFYLPLFLILYSLVYYISTKFLVTDDLLIHNFDISSSQEIEGGHTFFSMFFGFAYIKSVLSILTKAGILSFIISLLANRKFLDVLKVVMLASAVYVLGRASQFIFFVFAEPEKIKTLETNIFSLYAYIDVDQYSIYIQKLTYNISLIEFLFITLLVFGLNLNNTTSTILKIFLTVIVTDLGYILISSLI